MELHLNIIGTVLIILVSMHLFFPKRFNWKTELNHLSLLNRQMIQVHTFFIALLLLMIGILCIFYSYELIRSEFGKVIAGGLSIFWFIRLIFQLFVYSPQLWKGKVFETFMHVLFTFIWTYMSIIFGMIAWA